MSRFPPGCDRVVVEGVMASTKPRGGGTAATTATATTTQRYPDFLLHYLAALSQSFFFYIHPRAAQWLGNKSLHISQNNNTIG